MWTFSKKQDSTSIRDQVYVTGNKQKRLNKMKRRFSITLKRHIMRKPSFVIKILSELSEIQRI